MPIHEEIDPSKYARDAKVQPPIGDAQTIQATEIPTGSRHNEAESWAFDYEDASTAGIYQLMMTRIGGDAHSEMFRPT